MWKTNCFYFHDQPDYKSIKVGGAGTRYLTLSAEKSPTISQLDTSSAGATAVEMAVDSEIAAAAGDVAKASLEKGV